MLQRRSVAVGFSVCCLPSVCLSALLATAAMAAPTVDQALSLRPVQPGVDYDQPEDPKTCKLVPTKMPSGYELIDGTGQRLRRFLDSDGDKKLDQWCYYKEGSEVYRDIDADRNGSADQYRWLGLAGTRWGIDQNEDGNIDVWKYISAEEASAEAVEALKTRNLQRFQILLVSNSELKSLGLSRKQKMQIAKMTAEARKTFPEQAAKYALSAKSTWTNFSATRPGIVAAGSHGVTKDITVYENAVAVYQNDTGHEQLSLGTLLHVGNTWRLTQLPSSGHTEETPAGIFFTAVQEPTPQGLTQTGSSDDKTQQWLRDLEEIDQSLTNTGDPDEITKLNRERAEVLENIIDASTDDTVRANWIRQLADTLSAAVQTGSFPEGTERLMQLMVQLRDSATDVNQLPYVQFRHLSADYTQRLQDPENNEFHKVQDQWLKDLEAFVNEFPKSQDTGEAMLQLALAEEFAGKDYKAKEWYQRIVSSSADSLLVSKAKGAKRRLESVGKPLELTGTTLKGQLLDLSEMRGKVVVVQFWATWCDPCLDDMKELKRLVAEYGDQGFTPVGVNLDAEKTSAQDFLKNNRYYSWPHLHEEGGLDSRLANELGVLTLPTMLLVDQRGKVINRGLHSGELLNELERIFDQ